MAKKKKKVIQPINEVEIVNRGRRKYRTINLRDKEIIVFNEELKEFQLLSSVSASYDENSDTKDE